MRIILSPAKKMRVDDDLAPVGTPVYLPWAIQLLNYLKSLSYEELQKLWACSDKIAQENYDRLQNMKLDDARTPAILSYDGIAFQYMAPAVFETSQFRYVQEHLRILSGFYGVLKPMDAVTPYRQVAGTKNLYEFWGDRIYNEVADDSHVFVNLASKEYSKCVEKYLQPEDKMITCVFGQIEKWRVVQKGVYAKMARGDMVRYMAENSIEDPEQMKSYDRMGYTFREDLSSPQEYILVGGVPAKKIRDLENDLEERDE